MSPMTHHHLPESKESLWFLIVSPIVWAAHFLLCYITAAVWCEKYAPADGSLAPVRWAIAAYTAVALVIIGWNGWIGWRRSQHGPVDTKHFDSPADRHRFLGFATLLLAGLSAVATLFAGIVALFMEDCR